MAVKEKRVKLVVPKREVHGKQQVAGGILSKVIKFLNDENVHYTRLINNMKTPRIGNNANFIFAIYKKG